MLAMARISCAMEHVDHSDAGRAQADQRLPGEGCGLVVPD